MALWTGGFTFYSAVVVPSLHESFDSFQVGDVTRHVTWVLNLAGLVTVTIWWLGGRPGRSGGVRRVQTALLAVTTALLAAQFVLHSVMSARLDAGTVRSFYPLHRVYLWASTLQWAANVGLLVGVVSGKDAPALPPADALEG